MGQKSPLFGLDVEQNLFHAIAFVIERLKGLENTGVESMSETAASCQL